MSLFMLVTCFLLTSCSEAYDCKSSAAAKAAAKGNISDLRRALDESKDVCGDCEDALFCALSANSAPTVLAILDHEVPLKCFKESFGNPLELALLDAVRLKPEASARSVLRKIMSSAKSLHVSISWILRCQAVLEATKLGYDSIAKLTEVHRTNSEEAMLLLGPEYLQEALEEACSIPNDKLLATADYILKSERLVSPAANSSQAFIEACAAGNLSIVKLLLADGRVDPSGNNQEALMMSIDRGHTELVALLMSDDRVDPSTDDNLPFILACQNGKLGMVQLFAKDKRVDPSARNSMALQIAAQKGHAKVVEYLLNETNVDPTADGDTLCEVCLDVDSSVLKAILEDGRADPTVNDNMPLRYAASKGRAEHLRLLLQDGRADPNTHLGKALSLVVTNGFSWAFWALLHDPRTDLTIDNGHALRTIIESASSFHHLRILLGMLEDKRCSGLLTSRKWMKTVKADTHELVAELVWAAASFWSCKEPGKKGYIYVPRKYKPKYELNTLADLVTYLSDIAWENPVDLGAKTSKVVPSSESDSSPRSAQDSK